MSQVPLVVPPWFGKLSLQQQSTLLCALRGPDGIPKGSIFKDIQRAYRGSVLVAARKGRELRWGEAADDFMSMDLIAMNDAWEQVVAIFFRDIDALPHHYVMHLMHAAQILGHAHPDPRVRTRWSEFYRRCVDDMHLQPEPRQVMEARLNDWGRRDWGPNERGALDGEPAAINHGSWAPVAAQDDWTA